MGCPAQKGTVHGYQDSLVSNRDYLSVTLCSVGRAETVPLTRTIVEAAVLDPRRPDDQVRLDATRKPASSVLFSEAKAGDRIADLMSGNGYFTRILSDVVGPSGHIYAYIPTEQIAHCSPGEIAGTQAVARDSSYRNVTPAHWFTRGPSLA
jgi:predicted methyltransferase